MEAVPGEGNDAVGVPGGERHWYVAIVGNNSERLCGERLEARVADRPPEARAYEVYVPTQEETRVLPSGRRKRVERVVFRAMVFIRCTERTRRREIVYLPYIKRFMVDITGGTSGGPRPVAVIPDIQMARLRRMLDGSEEPVLIDTRPLPLRPGGPRAGDGRRPLFRDPRGPIRLRQDACRPRPAGPYRLTIDD